LSSTVPTNQSGIRLQLGELLILIRPAFFFIPLIGAMQVGPARGVAWALIVLVSVLVHELGHAMAMRGFGYGAWIELHALGGLTHWLSPPGKVTTPKQRFLVTFAGPGSGLALGLLLLLVQHFTVVPPSGLAGFVLQQGVYVNIVWSLINLAPIVPWDGGHLLDAGLEILTGKRRPTVVGLSSLVVALLGVAYAFYSQSFLLGYFAVQGGLAGWQTLKQGRGQGLAATAWQQVQAGNPAEGEALARARLAQTADPLEQAQLVELIAWARLHQKDPQGARQVLAQLPTFTPSAELRARLAAAENDIDQVVKLLEPLALAGKLSVSAFPLLVSALLALDAPQRVVAAARAVAGHGSFPRWEAKIHEASTRVFAHGDFQACFDLCAWASTRSASPVHAFNAACALSRLGRAEEGLTWLTLAVDAGYAELSALENDADIAAVRALPAFPALLAKARSHA
jgi:Zn-dependent protease